MKIGTHYPNSIMHVYVNSIIFVRHGQVKVFQGYAPFAKKHKYPYFP